MGESSIFSSGLGATFLHTMQNMLGDFSTQAIVKTPVVVTSSVRPRTASPMKIAVVSEGAKYLTVTLMCLIDGITS